ncbi:MAG: phosphate/phosphite/phosphonate ABC transporter substrate-binding protein [Candidatus Acidiferrales bacterium]
MGTRSSLIMGAVAYDPKVVTIWDGFQKYLRARGLAFDYVLFSNYEAQVEAHVMGQLHVAWNSPLAWLESERAAKALGRRAEAIVMRDTDIDLTSIVLVRADSGISKLADLKGKKVAVGASDSPQAKLIPLNFLAEQSLRPDADFTVIVFDKLVGKHGDHIGGERDAVRAVVNGEADAACILDGNRLGFTREGTISASSTRVLAQTPPFDHCNFTVLDGAPGEKIARFRDLLMQMSYANEEVRPLFDLERLKSWMPGRTQGYAQLAAAVDRFGTIDAFVKGVVAQCK